MSGKVVLSRHHARTANGTAKTMSGRTSTTITFFVWSNWKAALTANSSQDAELEHTPWARVHPRSFGRVQMGFPNATYVMLVGSSRAFDPPPALVCSVWGRLRRLGLWISGDPEIRFGCLRPCSRLVFSHRRCTCVPVGTAPPSRRASLLVPRSLRRSRPGSRAVCNRRWFGVAARSLLHHARAASARGARCAVRLFR